MTLKEYFFTSLVFVNLTLGVSHQKTEDYFFSNKEYLKISNKLTPEKVNSFSGTTHYNLVTEALEKKLLINIVFIAIFILSINKAKYNKNHSFRKRKKELKKKNLIFSFKSVIYRKNNKKRTYYYLGAISLFKPLYIH